MRDTTRKKKQADGTREKARRWLWFAGLYVGSLLAFASVTWLVKRLIA